MYIHNLPSRGSWNANNLLDNYIVQSLYIEASRPYRYIDKTTQSHGAHFPRESCRLGIPLSWLLAYTPTTEARCPANPEHPGQFDIAANTTCVDIVLPIVHRQ